MITRKVNLLAIMWDEGIIPEEILARLELDLNIKAALENYEYCLSVEDYRPGIPSIGFFQPPEGPRYRVHPSPYEAAYRMEKFLASRIREIVPRCFFISAEDEVEIIVCFIKYETKWHLEQLPYLVAREMED